MKVIAEGPCEVSKETFLPYVGKRIHFEAYGMQKGERTLFATDVDVKAHGNGVRLQNSVWESAVSDLEGERHMHLSEDQKYTMEI